MGSFDFFKPFLSGGQALFAKAQRVQFSFPTLVLVTFLIVLLRKPVVVQAPPTIIRCEDSSDVRLAISIRAPRSRGTVFTCVSPDFYYVKHFLYNYVSEGFDVKVYHADRVPLNGQNLPIHWCRVHVLQNFDVGLPPWIYSDADTRLNLTQVSSFLEMRKTYDGFIFGNGTERRIHEIRTDWFLIPNPDGKRTRAIINNWVSAAKDVPYQDQGVLNSLYPICRPFKGMTCKHYRRGPIRSMHCGSHNHSRAACMQDIIHKGEDIGKYKKSAR